MDLYRIPVTMSNTWTGVVESLVKRGGSGSFEVTVQPIKENNEEVQRKSAEGCPNKIAY